MMIKVNASLVKEAYNVGRGRGTSLSLGYAITPCGTAIFCRNPNSPDGIVVGNQSASFKGAVRLDMSHALELAELSGDGDVEISA